MKKKHEAWPLPRAILISIKSRRGSKLQVYFLNREIVGPELKILCGMFHPLMTEYSLIDLGKTEAFNFEIRTF